MHKSKGTLIKPYLSGTGSIDNGRKQQYVKIVGTIPEVIELLNPRSLCERHSLCLCLLAPELPDSMSAAKTNYWCRGNCGVKILSREYVNCSQKELWTYLIDFNSARVDPGKVFDESDSTIDVSECEDISIEHAAYI